MFLMNFFVRENEAQLRTLEKLRAKVRSCFFFLLFCIGKKEREKEKECSIATSTMSFFYN